MIVSAVVVFGDVYVVVVVFVDMVGFGIRVCFCGWWCCC